MKLRRSSVNIELYNGELAYISFWRRFDVNGMQGYEVRTFINYKYSLRSSYRRLWRALQRVTPKVKKTQEAYPFTWDGTTRYYEKTIIRYEFETVT